MSNQSEFLVSAIVSTYKSSRFIRGCLEDLTKQTLFIDGNLEVVVVDSASDENEGEIVCEFQAKYPNIQYIRTQQRQTVYGAWNIGIKASKGKYITNSNTDDRHHPDALRKMAHTLESNPDVSLVYADVFITTIPNETFEGSQKSEKYTWFDWDRDKLLYHGCFIGPQPMWRKVVHEDWGYFDESLIVSGDAEFWLRISQDCQFLHITEPLGLYLKHDESIEHRNKHRRDFENLRIITLYRDASHKGEIIRKPPQKQIMDFDKDILSIIAISRDNQNEQALKEMIKALTDSTFEVISITTDCKEGFASVLNNAIARISGQHIAVVTDNIIITDNTLKHLVNHLDNEVFITSPVTNERLSPNPTSYRDFKGLREFADRYRARNLHRCIQSMTVSFDCFALKTDLFSSIGVFDERFKNLKDCVNDMCLRAVLSDCKVNIAGDVYIHISDTNNYYKSDKKIFETKWGEIPIDSEMGKKILILNTIDEAHRLHKMGDLDSAVKVILHCIKITSEERYLTPTLVKILYLSGMYDDVIKISYAQISNDKELNFYLCLSLIHIGKFIEAESILGSERLKRHQEQYSLAVLTMKKGNLSQAAKLLESVINDAPSWGEPYRDLGLIQYSEGNRENGLLNIEKGFILSPCIPRISDLYHLLISSNSLYERAEIIFSDALRLNRHCNKVANFLIDILIKENKYQDALSEICSYFVNFGFDDNYIDNAISIRNIVGSLDNTDDENSISLCMIVRNEETNICKCLMSALPVVHEIIVVDTGSTDRTLKLAMVYGAKVLHYKWDEDFSHARNLSLEHAKGKWILILDADEVISQQDYDIIRESVKERDVAYRVVTRNYTNQTSLINFIQNDDSYREEKGLGWIPTLKVRLFPNDTRIRFKGNVHEMVDESIIETDINIKTAPFFIHHYGKLDILKDRQKGEKYYQLGLEKLKHNPTDKKSIKELAIVSSALGKIDEAIDLWNTLIGMGTTDDVDCYLNLSNLKILKGEYKEALYFAKKALQIEKENKTAINLLQFLIKQDIESN